VSRITPTIKKLHAQLLGKTISPQSFADTANSEFTSILQKTALEIMTHIDPSPHTRTTANSHNLDDADTLTYHQNKFKQAQNELLKLQTKKLLPTLHATMEMMKYLQDKILALCGIISENTHTIMQRILYHLKLAPTHLLMPESGKADLLSSTP